MANVDAYGQLIMTSGGVVPLANTGLTEATLDELATDSNFVGSNQNAGTFATQTLSSQVIAAAGITAENDIAYAFIRSAGTIKAALPVSGVNGGADLPAALPYPKRLASGDQVMVMANAVADREVALSVACSNGEYHVFSVTPAATGEHELISVLSGLSLGETLQGRTITHAFAMMGNNQSNMVSPIYIVNGSGLPVASVTPSDPLVDSGFFVKCVTSVALNSRAVFRTDA